MTVRCNHGIIQRIRMTALPNWSELEASNRGEMLAYFGTSYLAEKYITNELAWVITGVSSNDYNGVAWCRLEGENASQIIEETLKRFTSRGLPFTWHVGKDSLPADLPNRLEALGCRQLNPGVCMGMDLPYWKTLGNKVRGLVIEGVESEIDLSAWMDVWMHFDDGKREPRERLYASLALSGSRHLKHYLARLDGKPAGISQLFLGRETAGIYCVAVLSEARQRGIGTALTLAAIQNAKASGYRWCVLGPTRESQGMYARIGFELFPSNSLDYYR